MQLIWLLTIANPFADEPAAGATATPSSVPTTSMPSQATPKAEKLTTPNTIITSEQDTNTLQMQQESETKYLSALNELQMLKLAKELADVNQALINSKLATVQAEKNLLDALKSTTTSTTAPPPEGTTMGLPPNTHANSGAATPVTPLPSPTVEEDNYTVLSVSQLGHKWHAVVNYQNKLYHVGIGDTIPPNNFKIIFIDRSGITLAKHGIRRKISLVQII